MAWIRTVSRREAEGRLAELYRTIAPREDEAIDHILAAHSLHPEALERQLEMYRTIMFGRSPLGRRERELVAVAVSAANACEY